MGQAFTDQKAVRRYAKARVVMETAPVSSLEVVQTELLFEFLIVALDAPAILDGVDQLLVGDVRWQRAEEVFRRLGLTFGSAATPRRVVRPPSSPDGPL